MYPCSMHYMYTHAPCPIHYMYTHAPCPMHYMCTHAPYITCTPISHAPCPMHYMYTHFQATKCGLFTFSAAAWVILLAWNRQALPHSNPLSALGGSFFKLFGRFRVVRPFHWAFVKSSGWLWLRLFELHSALHASYTP